MSADPRVPLQDQPLRRTLIVPILLAALALVATAPGFGNQYTQDELPLILRNPSVQTLARPVHFFTTPYWHDPFPPALYRPLATASMALQWQAGGGNPRVYRWVSAALLAGAAIALFDLAALMLPLAAAGIVAGLFVIHPVHVESTALGVNQGEIAVALILCLATGWYIRARRAGDIGAGIAAGIWVLYLAAGLFKENGLVLPALLVAAETILIRDSRPWQARARRLRPFYLGLGLIGALILAARTTVLGGDVVGTFTADAFNGAGPLGRALTMLGVVPQWARLLFWPAHLQADYGPDEIPATIGWGTAQWAGTVFLALGATALALSWRRLPAVAFGLCWTAVALLPVSNVLVPTGIVLAERTLFLASAGAALVAGGIVSMAWRDPALSRVGRWGAALLVLSLLVLGLSAGRARHRVWRNQETLLRHTVIDAPRSFAAHLALARFLEDSGSVRDAAAEYRRAVEIRPALVHRDRALADQYRLAGLCRPAVRLYRRLQLISPGDAGLASALDECLRTLKPDSAVQHPLR